MNAQKFIAAAAVFVAAGSAFAADAPATAAVTVSADAANLNLPTVSMTSRAGQRRAEVRAEAVEFVKNYKTAFAIQLEQYKN